MKTLMLAAMVFGSALVAEAQGPAPSTLVQLTCNPCQPGDRLRITALAQHLDGPLPAMVRVIVWSPPPRTVALVVDAAHTLGPTHAATEAFAGMIPADALGLWVVEVVVLNPETRATLARHSVVLNICDEPGCHVPGSD